MSWRTSLAQPIYTIFGANTGVGKTIVSTLLVKAFAPNVTYIKPVSTGPLSEADYLHVDKFSGVVGKVLYQFETPCSPHLAAGPDPPSDSAILRKLTEEVNSSHDRPVLIESAGGVHSPTPSGTSQLELYRPLRFPVILVADSNLGGISTTISAYESLRLHGYDVAAIVGFRASWGNLPYLASKVPVPAIQIPAPPPRQENPEEDAENLSVYYDLIAASPAIQALKTELNDAHAARIQRLKEMPAEALKKLWYPFTQHSHLSPDSVTTIDSALNDNFAVFDAAKTSLKPVFDASASWWTQGLGHGNSELALEAAYAASRYGHVILPSAVNEPALALAESLLDTAGKGWASRVYYSDNGATGIEVALKMALKASRVRYGQDKEQLKLGIIGYTGSYHGDTIGAMDASDPNVYNAEVDWYQARGLFFDPPSIVMTKGKWHLQVPSQSEASHEKETFDELADVFNLEDRLQTSTAKIYRAWISRRLNAAIQSGQKFGALMFEPILLGAGGMILVDPLFQRLLVDLVRSSENLCPSATPTESDAWTGLPVITDEVFTGLYRLSVPRAFDLLGIYPDISVNAKLLTGGAVPLATTMATEQIFNVFLQDDKKDALLHGHSYTAHPIGTSVAIKSLATLCEIHASAVAENEQSEAQAIVAQSREDWKSDTLFSIWSRSFISALSHHEALSGVVCLGSVMAITLTTSGSGGYTSLASTKFLNALRLEGDEETAEVLARPLGNVVYFMASQTTTPETARRVEKAILKALA